MIIQNSEEWIIYRDHTSSKFVEVLNKYASDAFIVKNSGAIYLERDLYAGLEKWKSENIEVTKTFKALHLTSKIKKIIMKELDKQDVLAQEWYSELFGGVFVRANRMPEFAKIISKYKTPISDGKPLTAASIKARYGISESNLMYAVAAGRIKDYGGRFAEAEVEKLYKFDGLLLSLGSVLKEFENQYQVKVTQKMHLHIIHQLASADSRDFFMGNTLLLKKADSKDIYFEPNIVPQSKILDIIVHYPGGFPVSWQPFLWSRIPKKTGEYIAKYFEIEAGRVVDNPKLQQILNAAAKLSKEVECWNEGDLTMLSREGLSKASRFEITRFIKFVKAKGVQIRCDTNEIADFVSKKTKEYKDDAYSYEQFLELSSLVFDSLDPNESINLKDAINNAEKAQILLYLAMRYAVVWRRGTVIDITVHDLEDINFLIANLSEGKADKSRLIEIWRNFETTWGIMHKASKNNGDLVFWAPVDCYAMLGGYLTIAEYHRIREKKNYLIDRDIVRKKRCYLQALGEDNYRRIFGENNFAGTKLNKVVLMLFVEKTNLKYKGVTVRSMGELVAAHLRGHKLDLENGQKTILHYISSRSEGLTIDEISYELFVAGTVGYYKHLLAEKILPEYNKLRFKEQNVIINSLDVIPMEMEKKVDRFEIMYREVASITDNFYPDFSSFAHEIGKRLHAGLGRANEQNVICFYSLLAGERPDICKEQRYCTGCGEMNHEGLCKYGLYAKQYIYNLQQRIESLCRVNAKIENQIPHAVDKDGLFGTYRRNYDIIKYLRNLVIQFINNDEIPIEIGEAIKRQIMEDSRNAPAKLYRR